MELQEKGNKLSIADIGALTEMASHRNELLYFINQLRGFADISLALILGEEYNLINDQISKINLILNNNHLVKEINPISEVNYEKDVNLCKEVYVIIYYNYKLMLDSDIRSFSNSYEKKIRKFVKDIIFQNINHYDILFTYGQNKNYLDYPPIFPYD